MKQAAKPRRAKVVIKKDTDLNSEDESKEDVVPVKQKINCIPFLHVFFDRGYVIRCCDEIQKDPGDAETYSNLVSSWPLEQSKTPLRVELSHFSVHDIPLHRKVKISNVCGTLPISIYNKSKHSPAWIFKKTAMGMSHVCYTMHGYFTLMGNKSRLVFRGASTPKNLVLSAHRLFGESKQIIKSAMHIQLAVLSDTLNRCVAVQSGCVIEQMLKDRKWCMVVMRIDEIYNSILFHINKFPEFMADIGMKPTDGDDWSDLEGDGMPIKGTVSITRRGCVNFRIVWKQRGYLWENNERLKLWMLRLKEFLLKLC